MFKKALEYIYRLNNSKYFAGIIYLLLNIGSRFITIKLSKSTEAFIKYSFARELLIFSIAWMGTRDLFMALGMTACFTVLADYLLNADSRFCILPEKYKKLTKTLDLNNDGEVSDLEIAKAIKILEKAKKQKEHKNSVSMFPYYDTFNEDIDFDNDNYDEE
tara:strand:+ start:3217 stop:3699 length:483 start_codon:yes stop_codon:yes gene_type:complete